MKYSTDTYPFRRIIQTIIDRPLETLETDSKLFCRQNDQSSEHLRIIYDKIEEFLPTYKSFIENVIKPAYGQQIVYQKIPTFRIHYRNNVAVGEFHRDRDYGHNPKEINYFVPLTDAYRSATIYCESQEGKQDYKPLECAYGNFVVFDGCNLKHGNIPNVEKYTRVSFDFRVIPFSDYKETPGQSINTGKRFTIGDYYELI